MSTELKEIPKHYLEDKEDNDFNFLLIITVAQLNKKNLKTIRRRVNERLEVIVSDAGIEQHFTTYSIRHSWATIAIYLGNSTAIIREGFGHSSLKSTEIYLKRFDNTTLDEANECIDA